MKIMGFTKKIVLGFVAAMGIAAGVQANGLAQALGKFRDDVVIVPPTKK